MSLKFRKLRADEIDCRIGTIKETGLSLLLYKDARCDMNILDETVGALNWKRAHARDNANCIVSIYDDEKKEWISKEDVGTESNTEAVKGLASDSFKRACVNWGIGRELYTAPFIWVKAGDTKIIKAPNGKFKCFDEFKVAKLTFKENGEIDALAIQNTETNKLVFVKMPTEEYERQRDEESEAQPPKTWNKQNSTSPTNEDIVAMNKRVTAMPRTTDGKVVSTPPEGVSEKQWNYINTMLSHEYKLNYSDVRDVLENKIRPLVKSSADASRIIKEMQVRTPLEEL